MEVSAFPMSPPEGGKGFEKEQARLIEGHYAGIKSSLGQLGVSSDFTMGEGVKEVLPAQYVGPVVALPTLEENSLTVFISAHSQSQTARDASLSRYQTQVILAVPLPDKSSFLTDNDGRLYSDFFFGIEVPPNERPRIQLMKSKTPLPIDLLLAQWSGSEFGVSDEYILRDSILRGITDNKQGVKRILQEAGIAVPQGVSIHVDQSEEEILSVLKSMENSSETVVVKPNGGSQGKGVAMFASTNREGIRTHVQALQEEQTPVIIEERVTPLPLQLAGVDIDPNEVDWNVRTLFNLTVDAEGNSTPVYLDAEIRFAKKTDGPVNVQKGAQAVCAQDVLSPEIFEQVCEAAQKAAAAIHTVSLKQGGKQLPGIIGMDTIAAKDGRMVMLEGNSGAVGGLSTICHITNKPLKSIPQSFLPSLSPQLSRNKKKRADGISSASLRRLALSTEETFRLAGSFYYAGDVQKAKEMYKQISIREDMTNMSNIARFNLAIIQIKLKEYKEAAQLLEVLIEKDPDSPYMLAALAQAYRKGGDADKAQKLLAPAEIEKGLLHEAVIFEKFVLDVLAGKGDQVIGEVTKMQLSAHTIGKGYNEAFQYMMLGQIFKEAGDYRKAMGFYFKMIPPALSGFSRGLHVLREQRKQK